MNDYERQLLTEALRSTEEGPKAFRRLTFSPAEQAAIEEARRYAGITHDPAKVAQALLKAPPGLLQEAAKDPGNWSSDEIFVHLDGSTDTYDVDGDVDADSLYHGVGDNAKGAEKPAQHGNKKVNRILERARNLTLDQKRALIENLRARRSHK